MFKPYSSVWSELPTFNRQVTGSNPVMDSFFDSNINLRLYQMQHALLLLSNTLLRCFKPGGSA